MVDSGGVMGCSYVLLQLGDGEILNGKDKNRKKNIAKSQDTCNSNTKTADDDEDHDDHKFRIVPPFNLKTKKKFKTNTPVFKQGYSFGLPPSSTTTISSLLEDDSPFQIKSTPSNNTTQSTSFSSSPPPTSLKTPTLKLHLLSEPPTNSKESRVPLKDEQLIGSLQLSLTRLLAFANGSTSVLENDGVRGLFERLKRTDVTDETRKKGK